MALSPSFALVSILSLVPVIKEEVPVLLFNFEKSTSNVKQYSSGILLSSNTSAIACTMASHPAGTLTPGLGL